MGESDKDGAYKNKSCAFSAQWAEQQHHVEPVLFFGIEGSTNLMHQGFEI